MLLIEVGLVSNCVAVQRSAASLFPMFDLRPRTAVDGRTETFANDAARPTAPVRLDPTPCCRSFNRTTNDK